MHKGRYRDIGKGFAECILAAIEDLFYKSEIDGEKRKQYALKSPVEYTYLYLIHWSMKITGFN